MQLLDELDGGTERGAARMNWYNMSRTIIGNRYMGKVAAEAENWEMKHATV